MSILTNLMNGRSALATFKDADGWFYDALTDGGRSVSGERVSAQTAMTLAVYYACIRVISEDVGKLPLKTYRKAIDGRNKQPKTSHPLYPLLHDAPNDEMTAMTWRETMTQHALGWGNGYSEITRMTKTGRIWGLMGPLDPATVTPQRNGASDIEYVVRPTDGAPERTLPRDRMFHFHGLGFDGLTGYSVAQKARESIGLAMAERNSGSAMFGNSSRPAGVLEYDKELTDQAKANIKKSWKGQYGGGAENAHQTAVLEYGVKWKPIAVPSKDAQWIQSRQFSVEEICRWFRVAPHKVQHLLHATFTNIEHQGIEHVGDTLLPWLVRWEQEIKRQLISKSEPNIFVEHVVDALLRGDTESRYKAHATARQWGWESTNDVLALENRNGIGEQGDIYLIPMNMQDASKINEPKPFVERRRSVVPVAEPESEPETAADLSAMRIVISDETRRQMREGNSPEMVDRIAAAHLPLLTQTYRRLLRNEYERAERAAKRGDLQQWADKFYASHGEQVRGALIPVVECFAGSTWGILNGGDMPRGVSESVASQTETMAQVHIAVSSERFSHEPLEWDEELPERTARAELGRLSGILREAAHQNAISN